MAETIKTEVLVVGAGASGIPAAISVRQKCEPRQLDPKGLQKILKSPKQGEVLLGSELSG